MKKIKILKLFSLVALIAVSACFSSCEEDEAANSGLVELESFGPSGVKHGETIKFIGKNLNKVSAIILKPNIEITNFETQSSNLIEVMVPKEAEAGKVVLVTPQGEVESKTVLSFEVPVVVNSITPEAKPGTNITITGDLLNWIETITFDDDIVVEDFVSKSMDELVVQVPLEAQTGFLIFSTGGTEPLTFASEEELVVTLPAVTSISPAAVKHMENVVISGTDLDLVTTVLFEGDLEVQAVDFIRQSETEIEVQVPPMTLKGPLTLTQFSPVNIVTDEELTIILPIGTSVTPSPATPGVDNITITGTDLDLVASLALPGAGVVDAQNFISHSDTEIVLALPAEATAGGISYTTIHDFSSLLGVNVVLPGAGPPPLAITLYDEEVANGGGDWSWNIGVSDPASTEQFYSGDVSWKFTTTSDGGLSVGGLSPAVDASGQNVYTFALFGGPGTDGATVAVILNDNWGNYNSVTLVEGEWTVYEIDLSNYPGVDLSSIVRWAFKVEGLSGTTIYVDRVGFDAGGPPPLDYYIYDDAYQNGWQNYDGWGWDSKDIASEEEVFKGEKAIKMVFNDQYGALQFASPSTDVFTNYTTLSFRVFATEDQDLIVQLNNDSDNFLSIPAGWSLVELPVADLPGSGSVTELRIKNNNPNLPTTLYFDEIGLKN